MILTIVFYSVSIGLAGCGFLLAIINACSKKQGRWERNFNHTLLMLAGICAILATVRL